MKLYTRTGDDGTTGLFGGHRVPKDHPRVRAYGAVDELNAVIGLARAACDADEEVPARLGAILGEIQSRLFDVGADLATPAGSPHETKVERFDARHVAGAETWIDEIDAGNALMQAFVLPGGCELAARLHVARTTCRRAERDVVALGMSEPVTESIGIYLNRLSDLLFAMARRANRAAGVPDVPWLPGRDDG